MHIKELDFFSGGYDQFVNVVAANFGSDVRKVVVTPNVDFWVRANSDLSFRRTLKSADYLICDGTPIYWLMKIRSLLFGDKSVSKITGSDLLSIFIEKVAKSSPKILFIGGEDGVAQKASAHFSKKFEIDQSRLSAYCPPVGFEKCPVEMAKLVSFIKNENPNYIFLALGSPKQEDWIFNNRSKFGFDVAFCVGAAFDFVVGHKKRAPLFMQRVGLEWFWRLSNEPARLWRRYSRNLISLPSLFLYSLKR